MKLVSYDILALGNVSGHMETRYLSLLCNLGCALSVY